MSNYRKNESALSQLTRQQFDVTQHGATERAFTGEFWNNHEPGLYVDIVSGEPLFASIDKFDSGSGWPSFTVPIDPLHGVLMLDRRFGMVLPDVRSYLAERPRGHLFDDAPTDAGGKRYCINSAAMKFVPVADLQKEGYGEFAALFETMDAAAQRAGGHPSQNENTDKKEIVS
jgi:peptide-methionine (R)-S-oxide reductase